MNNAIERGKKKLKNRGGFTLIELIVVIVIIGILAAIIIPRLSGFSDTAQDRADLATARTIYSAAAAANAAGETFGTDGATNVRMLETKEYLETNPGGGFGVTVDNGDITVTYSGGTYPDRTP